MNTYLLNKYQVPLITFFKGTFLKIKIPITDTKNNPIPIGNLDFLFAIKPNNESLYCNYCKTVKRANSIVDVVLEDEDFKYLNENGEKMFFNTKTVFFSFYIIKNKTPTIKYKQLYIQGQINIM